MIDLMKNSDHPLILGGGLGMQLLHDGLDSVEKSPLWSAAAVCSNPEAIESVYFKFLDAGAEIVETATYQMTFEGFSRHLKMKTNEIIECFNIAVRLAHSAIEKYKKMNNSGDKKYYVTGNVGPYGALLADRSEYTGSYWGKIPVEKIRFEQQQRVSALVNAGVDFIAFETIPTTAEADLVIDLMNSQFPETPFYLSLVSHDGIQTPRGENLLDYFEKVADATPNLIALGLNCSPVESISIFSKNFADSNAHGKLNEHVKFIFYPNLDEPLKPKDENERFSFWDEKVQLWMKNIPPSRILSIGGCCYVLAEDILAITKSVHSEKSG